LQGVPQVFFGKLFGKKEQTYYFASNAGLQFLMEQSEEDTPEQIELPAPGNLTADDISDAIFDFKNSFSPDPYASDEKILWANRVLDDDIKFEIETASRKTASRLAPS